MSEEQVVVVFWTGRRYHKPQGIPLEGAPASTRLGTACGLDIATHDLVLYDDRARTEQSYQPCKRCYNDSR